MTLYTRNKQTKNPPLHGKGKYRKKVLVAQSCLTLCNSMDSSPPGSYANGIFQPRILEWVAISFSRVSSWLGSNLGLPHRRQILYHLSHQGRKGNHQQNQKAASEQKIFANYIFDKGLISKIYKELIQLNGKIVQLKNGLCI